jgi:photosystem II stability/assembly factor-like uncharacterized protein
MIKYNLTLIIIFLLSIISGQLLAQNSGQEWELIGLENLSIEHVYSKGDTIWAGTLDSTFKSEIYYSFTSGEEWLKVADTDTLINGWLKLLRVSPDNILTIYASTLNGRGLKSTDGGESWEYIFTDFEPWPERTWVKNIYISPHSKKVMFGIVQTGVVSAIDNLYRTTDCGIEWEYINGFASSSHGVKLAFAFDPVDSIKMYATADTQFDQLFYVSTNGGTQWINRSELSGSSQLIIPSYSNPNTIYIFRYPVRTTDNGYNWERILNGIIVDSLYFQPWVTSALMRPKNSNELYVSIVKWDSTITFVQTLGIFKTIVGLDDWELITGSENLNLRFTGDGSNNLFVDSTTNKLYVGTRKGVYVYDLLTTIDNEVESFPSDFILHQNYPNPFNPYTIISYQLPVSGFVVLKIYDQLGREITTLVSKEQSTGSYEVKFDGTKLSSSVYIYRLTVGTTSLVRKMLLLK